MSLPLLRLLSLHYTWVHRRSCVSQLPKILLPHQQSTLDSRIANTDELIADEMAALETEKETIKKTSRANKARIEELTERLSELRKQVKPGRAARDTDRSAKESDDFGRMPRGEDAEGDVKMDQEKAVDETERDDREKGVQIKGDDGDVEVEY